METLLRMQSPAEVITTLPSSSSNTTSVSFTSSSGSTGVGTTTITNRRTYKNHPKKQKRTSLRGESSNTTTKGTTTSNDENTVTNPTTIRSQRTHRDHHHPHPRRYGTTTNAAAASTYNSITDDMATIELISDQIMRMMQQEERIYQQRQHHHGGCRCHGCSTVIMRNDFDRVVNKPEVTTRRRVKSRSSSSSASSDAFFIEKTYSESSIDNVRDIALIEAPLSKLVVVPQIRSSVNTTADARNLPSHHHYHYHSHQSSPPTPLPLRYRYPVVAPVTTTPSSLHPFFFWRQQMYDWSCLVVDSYHIHRECVTLSFNLLDRYLSYELSLMHDTKLGSAVATPPPITRDDYQLFSMTCLYIAIKLLVGTTTMTTTVTTTSGTDSGSCYSGRSMTSVLKSTIQTFVDMSKHHYSQAVIERTERDIVYGLNWYLHAPTSTSYVRLLMQLLSRRFVHPIHPPILGAIERTAYEITELAIVHTTYFCHDTAMDIALAATHQALRIQQHRHYNNHIHTVVSLDRYWNMILQYVPIVQCKQECPNFRRLYMELAELYCK